MKKVLLAFIMVSLLMTSVFQICFSVDAVCIKNKKIVDNTQKELVTNIGQPDLIITDVDIYTHLGGNTIRLTVRNIGDKYVRNITAKAVIYQHFIFFRIYRKTEEIFWHFNTLEPGRLCEIFVGSPPFSFFSIFEFNCEVYSEGESDYTNNYRNKKFLCIFNFYSPIKY